MSLLVNYISNPVLFFLLTILVSVSSLLYAIEIKDSNIDFGQVQESSILNYETEVKNNNSNVIHIGVRASCDCINIVPERFGLDPFEIQKIKININLKGYTDKFQEKIFFQSNDQKNPYFAVDITARIIHAKSNAVIWMSIFAAENCLFCKKIKKEIIPVLAEKYNVEIKVKEYDINMPENYETLLFMEKKYNKTLNKMPVIFIGTDILGGRTEITEKLPVIINKYADKGTKEIEIQKSNGDVKRKDAAKKLKFAPLLIAGLIDGINPCAFAAILFLTAYLNFSLKKNRQEILIIGLVFILGVFITYFLIGIGIFQVVQKIDSIMILSKIMYISIGAFTLYLAGQHLYEAIIIKNQRIIKSSDITLKIPDNIKAKIYGILKIAVNHKYVLVYIFIVSAVITLLELVCTGQIYLPTIIYLFKIGGYKTSSVLYLLFYCFLFILPLLAVLLFTYFGSASEKFKKFFTVRVFWSKIIMSVFFLILSVLILLNVFN